MLSKNNALHETALSSTFWVLHFSGFFSFVFIYLLCASLQRESNERQWQKDVFFFCLEEQTLNSTRSVPVKEARIPFLA